MHDVTAWLTNNCNTHIDQYLKLRQLLENNKIFFFKNHVEKSLVFKKAAYKVKESGLQLSFNIFC